MFIVRTELRRKSRQIFFFAFAGLPALRRMTASFILYVFARSEGRMLLRWRLLPTMIMVAASRSILRTRMPKSGWGSDIRTTANIYDHLDTAQKQALADRLSHCLHS